MAIHEMLTIREVSPRFREWTCTCGASGKGRIRPGEPGPARLWWKHISPEDVRDTNAYLNQATDCGGKLPGMDDHRRVAAVRELHTSRWDGFNKQLICKTCVVDYVCSGEHEPWPCETAQVVYDDDEIQKVTARRAVRR